MSIESQLRATSRNANAAIEAGLRQPGVAKPTADVKAKASKKEAKPARDAGSTTEKRSRYADDAVITVKGTEHGLSGKRGQALDCMKTGMAVEQYKSALAKKGLAGYAGWSLNRAQALKFIAVK